MKNDMKILGGILLVTILIIFGSVVLVKNDKKPNRNKLGSASLTIDKKIEDLGKMKPAEERTATFAITNTGSSVLRIWDITTSCNCTFASIVIDGKQTGEFNMPMHTKPELKNWIGEIGAKQTALLKVTYKPRVMLVTGAVSRQVTFATNDPTNQTIEVSVKAFVL